MAKLKVLMTLGIVTTMLTFENCGFDIEETNTNFQWVVKGNRLTYDLNMADKKIENYRILEISENQGASSKNMTFIEISPDIPNDPNGTQLLLGLLFHVYRLNDGLHTTACFSCSVNPCLSVINYLKVPVSPTRGQSIPSYLCKDVTYSHDIVLSTDSLITVPLGKFKTFVINDTLRRSVKFWNEKIGLIRVDNYNEYLKDTVKLELSKTNY